MLSSCVAWCEYEDFEQFFSEPVRPERAASSEQGTHTRAHTRAHGADATQRDPHTEQHTTQATRRH
jgi:hypothetical protein